MIDDPNIEYEDRPELDEDGEPIFYIDDDYTADEFTPYNFNEEPPAFPDSYYESVWDDGTGINTLADDENTGEELTNRLDLEEELDDGVSIEQENTINQAEERYNEAVDTIIDVLTSVLEKGEITAEDNANILQAQSTISETEEQIKQICNQSKTMNISEQLEKIRENMVGATVDDILGILTENGTKPWLYKDDNNNVLVDMQSIPELTVLVNKLNLIASGGDDDAAEIQLTPEFINMVVQSAGSGNSVKSVTTMYYLSTSKTELIGGTWTDTLPTVTEQQGKYLWYKIVTTYMDAEKEPTETEPICISTKEEFDGYTMLLMKDTIVVTCDENGNLL